MTEQAPGLSCYTANLAAYLEGGETVGSTDFLAASVRLAVDLDRPDGLIAMSHHDRPLNRLGDGSRLIYQGFDDIEAVRAAVRHELDRYGRALVVGYSSQLPWSAAPGGTAAPHFVLVDGHETGRWHVHDRFTGLMSSGTEQEPFDGWIDDAGLGSLMRRDHDEPAKHRLRNTFAFGFAVPVPGDRRYLLLQRRLQRIRPSVLPGRWITDSATALERLGERLSDGDALLGDPDVVDDCWAASRHHLFRYRRLTRHMGYRTTDARQRKALTAAADRWSKLPRTLRFAVASVHRGRARPSLVRGAFTELADLEHETSRTAAGALAVLDGPGD
ncbi:hypothetical protein DMH01_36400 [Amycolatopsis sp. WAC 04182]|uniref:hypothetical protein n=1 Tax=Amycolatopsis sp. WAC 04182 TaxID=2203198 RepID=UPI000F787C32|nr:hypothetical protein [Amycolatopsis sp. WAC 04182]RSN54426.1 hypothetical protein DMH01_36400 [Amycolatopsis sp. WAC 04182]